MKLQKLVSALAAAGLTVALGSAQASSTFSFNPNGTGAVGAIANAGILDQAAGSTLAVGGAGGGAVLPNGTVLTNLYQSNLSAVQTTGAGNLFSNGTGGNFFTFVANFTEVVTGGLAIPGAGINTFAITGGTFKMCAQAALGNNLAGTGFSCAGNGILSGTITGGTATQTAFFTAPTLLDQAGGDDWGGTQTLRSNGAADLNATINFVDSNYFPDLMAGVTFVLAAVNSSLITPFSQTDPSRLFSSNTVANGDVAANVGAVNGLTGPDFIFQADANSSFTRSVPEPGSLAIVGVALAALSFVRRRKS